MRFTAQLLIDEQSSFVRLTSADGEPVSGSDRRAITRYLRSLDQDVALQWSDDGLSFLVLPGVRITDTGAMLTYIRYIAQQLLIPYEEIPVERVQLVKVSDIV